MIADLWSEREEQSRPVVPPVVAVAPVPLASPPPIRARARARAGGHGKKIGLIAAIVAVAVLLAGGVGVFLATRGGTSSKATFIAKADALCAPANQPVATVGKPTNYPELATAVGTVVTATDAQVTELRKFTVPGGTAGGQANSVIGAMTSASQAAHGLQDAAGRKDDAATATATTQVAARYGDAAAQAKAYGFGACATGMQSGIGNLVGGSTALIKTAFMAKADSLCRAAARTLATIPTPKDDARDLSRYFAQAVPLLSRLVIDLRAITVAPGDEPVVAEMFAAEDKVVAKAVEMKESASGYDRSRFIAADQENSVLTTAADAKLDAYGLGICGSNFGKS